MASIEKFLPSEPVNVHTDSGEHLAIIRSHATVRNPTTKEITYSVEMITPISQKGKIYSVSVRDIKKLTNRTRIPWAAVKFICGWIPDSLGQRLGCQQ